jgi:hypothetical protein
VARPQIPRHHKANNCPQIASRSIHLDASALGDFFHRNVVDGDAKASIGRVSEEVCSNLRSFVSLLASGTNGELPSDSAAIPSGLHGMRFILLGEHSVLDQETTANLRKKQLVRRGLATAEKLFSARYHN